MTETSSNDAQAYSLDLERFGEGAASESSDFPRERLPKEDKEIGGLDANVLGERRRVALGRSAIGLTAVVDVCVLEVSACDRVSC